MNHYRQEVVTIPGKKDNPKKTAAQQRAQEKYMSKLSRVEITMPKDRKQRLQDHTAATGESVNSFVNRAIEETMERDQDAADNN